MYAARYHIPDPLRPMDSLFVGSPSHADSYVPSPNAWQHHSPASPQDGQWTQISAPHLHPTPGPCVNGGEDMSQVRAETSNHNTPPDVPEHVHGHISDPSPFAQSTPSGMKSSGAGRALAGASVKPGRKRRRAAHQTAAKHTGACARCRRLKMKCTFTKPEDEVCSRCTAGAYECVFPGRKPRGPTMSVVLRKRMRETDAMIDKLLLRVNPGTTMAMPLALVPARLPLSSRERTEYRNILSYLEHAPQQGGRRFDVSALEGTMPEDSDTDEEMSNGAASPGERRSPVERAVRPVDSILEVTAPMGIMATAALQNNRVAASAMADDSSTDSAPSRSSRGVASESYFLPGPQANLQLRRLIVERQAAPDILLSGLVTPEDVTALFEIHYKWINPIVPILDENIHSPASVLARCPFLFTVICTVAARYYKEKPHIYGMAIHFAKAAAANAVIEGWKTVETCQAFTLWSLYSPPARRWEEDRAWGYTGIAFRLAMELNLSRIPEPSSDERQERESHNRTRMWLMCFVVDHCLSIHSGKAWMVQEDATIRNAASWLHNFKYHNQCDQYLASLTELLTIVSRFVGMINPVFGTTSVESVNEKEFTALYKAFNNELMVYKGVIDERHRGEKESSDPAIVIKITVIYCVFHYCRLVICCSGIELMIKNKATESNELFAGCLQAATSLIDLMVKDFVPSGFVPYLPEQIFVHSAFAAVVLLKCLRPEYSAYLDIQQEERIIELVQRLFTIWTSDEFSLDESNNMQLYAKFLKQIMEPHVARLAMKKRAAFVFDSGDVPSLTPPWAVAASTLRTPAGSDGSNGVAPFSTKVDYPYVWSTAHSGSSGSAARNPIFPYHIPSAAPATTSPLTVSIGDLYATEIDNSKETLQLASATGVTVHPDMNLENVSWEQLMAAGASLGGEFGGGMLGPGVGSSGAGDGAMGWSGMSSDEYLAAMMGLGDRTWFLTAGPGGS